ncbi:hypothetical protein [Natronorubrum tibetense]|nr:hypothetical protein [Natronorubrum tibetense]
MNADVVEPVVYDEWLEDNEGERATVPDPSESDGQRSVGATEH